LLIPTAVCRPGFPNPKIIPAHPAAAATRAQIYFVDFSWGLRTRLYAVVRSAHLTGPPDLNEAGEVGI
jgi:hypothetical protein